MTRTGNAPPPDWTMEQRRTMEIAAARAKRKVTPCTIPEGIDDPARSGRHSGAASRVPVSKGGPLW